MYAFVVSRLDYCNAILAGLPRCSIASPQRLSPWTGTSSTSGMVPNRAVIVDSVCVRKETEADVDIGTASTPTSVHAVHSFTLADYTVYVTCIRLTAAAATILQLLLMMMMIIRLLHSCVRRTGIIIHSE